MLPWMLLRSLSQSWKNLHENLCLIWCDRCVGNFLDVFPKMIFFKSTISRPLPKPTRMLVSPCRPWWRTCTEIRALLDFTVESKPTFSEPVSWMPPKWESTICPRDRLPPWLDGPERISEPRFAPVSSPGFSWHAPCLPLTESVPISWVNQPTKRFTTDLSIVLSRPSRTTVSHPSGVVSSLCKYKMTLSNRLFLVFAKWLTNNGHAIF